jgi:hypothetical protein
MKFICYPKKKTWRSFLIGEGKKQKKNANNVALFTLTKSGGKMVNYVMEN